MRRTSTIICMEKGFGSSRSALVHDSKNTKFSWGLKINGSRLLRVCRIMQLLHIIPAVMGNTIKWTTRGRLEQRNFLAFGQELPHQFAYYNVLCYFFSIAEVVLILCGHLDLFIFAEVWTWSQCLTKILTCPTQVKWSTGN